MAPPIKFVKIKRTGNVDCMEGNGTERKIMLGHSGRQWKRADH